ncbi:MAG: DUF1801 domain-containing protein [Bacteroidia bacterium]|nr:DUF1801 domain-containing protein [Bacteroidia bacterium]
MAEIKTKQTNADVGKFIRAFSNNDQKIRDSFELVSLMSKWTGYEPKMWGPSIIGFGKYHYKSERSSQEGDWPLIGFSPRKAAISLYVFTGAKEHEYLLEGLGKYKVAKACIYIKKLSDIDQKVLKKLILESIKYTEKKYGKYKEKPEKIPAKTKLRDGDSVKVIAGTHAGKSGTAKDLNISKTGHLTITVLQKNGVRFKTLAKNVVLDNK